MNKHKVLHIASIMLLLNSAVGRALGETKSESNFMDIVKKAQKEKHSEWEQRDKVIKRILKKNSIKNNADKPIHCYTAHLSERDKDMCLAAAEHNPSHCYTAHLSERDKDMCLGSATH